MGGIVGLTVRLDRERTYRGSCWTNALPHGLWAAPFYVDLATSRRHTEAWLDALLENRRVDPDVESLWGGWDKLAPVEYGLVVVDYVTSTLVSAQGYVSPASVYVADRNIDDGASAEKYLALEQAGLLKQLPPRPFAKKAQIKLPFEHAILGDRDAVNADLRKWCEENFGLSAEERCVWDEWLARRAKDDDE